MDGPLRFDGRVAVVTGAGRGLGRAHAVILAARGAAVVVNDLGATLDGSAVVGSPAADVVAEIDAAGGQAVADGGDVSTPSGAASAVAAALARFGRLDIVVNNAGIVHRSRFPDTTADDLARHVAVHQVGTFNVTRAAWPHLAAQRYGRVVMTVSSALFGIPDVVAYSSAKGGVFGLAKGLALAGRDCGIAVNMVAPIAFTRMMASGIADGDALRERAERLPPERVAALVAVLTHEACPGTGEMYLAGGDHISRVFLAETAGWTAAEQTPEHILAHWPQIHDEAGYRLPGPVFEGAALAATGKE